MFYFTCNHGLTGLLSSLRQPAARLVCHGAVCSVRYSSPYTVCVRYHQCADDTQLQYMTARPGVNETFSTILRLASNASLAGS